MNEPVNQAKRSHNMRKLALADRIRQDGRLSPSTKMIGAELCSLVNFEKGYAFAPELYLAERLCTTTRTVKRAVAMLQKAGHFEVVKSGRSNRYLPNFNAAEKGTDCPLLENQQGTDCPLSEAEQGTESVGTGDKFDRNRGQKRPPISLETSLGSSAASGGAGRDGAAESAAAPARNTQPDQLGGFAAALEARLGTAQFKSWFSKVAFVSEVGSTLTLAAPGKFNASHIKNFLEAEVLEVWRRERPHIARLEMIVAAALATPKPINVESIGARRAGGDNEDGRWLVDEGVALVSTHMHQHRANSEKQIIGWLRRCGNDAAGLRRILSEASQQQLFEEQFANVVKQQTRALLQADQRPLPLAPVAVSSKRSA